MDLIWWLIAAGVVVPLVLTFLAGNSVETHRGRRLLLRVADEWHDLEDERRELDAGWAELEAGWAELDAGWRELESRKADLGDCQYNEHRRVSTA